MGVLDPPHADCPCLCHTDALVPCDSATCEAINHYRAEDVAAFQAACDHHVVPGHGCVRCGKGRPDWTVDLPAAQEEGGTYTWKPGYRHQVAWLPDSARWWCKECGQQFEVWPPDDQACPGPAAQEEGG